MTKRKWLVIFGGLLIIAAAAIVLMTADRPLREGKTAGTSSEDQDKANSRDSHASTNPHDRNKVTREANANHAKRPGQSQGNENSTTNSQEANPNKASSPQADSETKGTQAEDGGLSEEERAIQAIRCKVRGKITRDGKPDAGVKILLHKRYGIGEFTSTTSDELGTFHFDELRHGRYAVNAHLKNAFAKGVMIHCDAEDKEIPVELEIRKVGVHVTGRVSDNEGNPLAGAYLQVAKQDHPKDNLDGLVLPVPPEGRYEIWLPVDEHEFCIVGSAPGHQSHIKTVPKNKSAVVLDFRLSRESVLRGEVVGPSGLVKGVKVAALHKRPDGTGYISSDKTDARGRFSIETSEAQVTLSAYSAKDGWAYQVLPPRQEGTDLEWILLELKPGREITGTVRLANGNRVPLAEVHFYCEKAAISGIAKADTQGDFKISNLPTGQIIMAGPWGDKRPYEDRYTEIPPEQSTVELVLHPSEE